MTMETKELDIVYCVKSGEPNEELRYSLRSLKNMPHNKVWIFGFAPNWVNRETVNVVEMKQNGNSKWEKCADSLRKIADTKELTEDFIWFNDDFFVLKPIEKLDYWYDRDLESRCHDFFVAFKGKAVNYPARLTQAKFALADANLPTLNYELHLPIIFNRKKFKKLWKLYPGVGAKRSLYCNTYGVKGEQRPDCKVYQTYQKANLKIDFISTSDASFKDGQVGKQIRNMFKEKCEYER